MLAMSLDALGHARSADEAHAATERAIEELRAQHAYAAQSTHLSAAQRAELARLNQQRA
jgi:hypothetical protein